MQRWVSERYGEEDDFDFYAVNINEDRDLVAEYVDNIGLEVPVILGTSQLFNQYRLRDGVSPYPADYVIDGEGIVRYANHEYEPEIILMTIDRLLEIQQDDEEPIINVIPDTLDFGEVEIGSSVDRSVTVYNIGDADLVISDITIESDGFSVDFDGEATVEPNDSLDVTVTFSPPNIAVYEGILTITSNDSSSSEVTVNLLGTGRSGDAVIDESAGSIPAEYFLSEPYPNPFNAVTGFSYGLPEASAVRIAVCDVGGRVITTLVDSRQTAGRYTAHWNAGASPNGIYVIKFAAGDEVISRKVVLIR